jgi:hypothetical protein
MAAICQLRSSGVCGGKKSAENGTPERVTLLNNLKTTTDVASSNRRKKVWQQEESR